MVECFTLDFHCFSFVLMWRVLSRYECFGMFVLFLGLQVIVIGFILHSLGLFESAF